MVGGMAGTGDAAHATAVDFVLRWWHTTVRVTLRVAGDTVALSRLNGGSLALVNPARCR